MSHYQPGGLGEFRGRTGQTIVYRWRHLKIGRSRPGKSSKEPSDRQKKQRSRLGLISRYLSKFVLVIRDGYPSKRRLMTPMNAAVKQNFHTAITGKFPNFTIDDSLVQLSKGTLDLIYRPKVIISDNGDVAIEWINSARQKPGVEDHDKVHFVFYSDVLRRRQLLYWDHLALRRDAHADMPDTLAYLKGPVHAWMFLASEDGKRVSNSRYLGAFHFQKK